MATVTKKDLALIISEKIGCTLTLHKPDGSKRIQATHIVYIALKSVFAGYHQR